MIGVSPSGPSYTVFLNEFSQVLTQVDRNWFSFDFVVHCSHKCLSGKRIVVVVHCDLGCSFCEESFCGSAVSKLPAFLQQFLTANKGCTTEEIKKTS